MSELRSRPTAIDLFAGAGGLSLGFEQAGFDVVAAVEIDPIHAATHALNFPRTAVVCRDIAFLSGSDILGRAGLAGASVDAVIGGPPCQGFSLIGHRVLEDPRNALVFHFLRLVREIRPRTFMMENVPGMATGGHTQLLQELVERFKASGYDVRLRYRTLNAANYGVPQDRERLFLLGACRGERLPEYPRPTSSLRRANGRNGSAVLFEDLPACPTVQNAIGDLPDVEKYLELFDSDEMEARYSDGSTYARNLRGELRDPGDLSYQRAVREGVLTGCRRARHTQRSRERFAATKGGKTEPVSRFFKLSAAGVSNTLRAGTASDRGAFSAPRPIHPLQARCITVREAARLHSYPDWFRFHQTIWHGFRQIGNSVPPLLARAVAAEIVRALGASPQRPKVRLELGDSALASLNMSAAAAYFGVPANVIAPRLRAASGSE